jgi:hypothetical protein
MQLEILVNKLDEELDKSKLQEKMGNVSAFPCFFCAPCSSYFILFTSYYLPGFSCLNNSNVQKSIIICYIRKIKQ